MKTKIMRFALFLALLFSLWTPAQKAQASSPEKDTSPAGLTSPAEFLNSDGTLKRDGSFNGALDLDGYNVQIDPQRGPVFTNNPAPATGQWGALGSSFASPTDIVSAIAMIGTDVYIGGNFTKIGDDYTVSYIARWNGTTWSNLGISPINNTVRALLVNGSDLYVGGSFTDAGYDPLADYIAKWDGTDWSALGSNGLGNGAFNSDVYTLAMLGSNLYAGGNFTNAGGNPAADYIAKWNGVQWLELDSMPGGGGSLNNAVRALAVIGTNLYVGGSFVNVDGIGSADYIARWSGSIWYNLDSNNLGNGSLNNPVNALAVIGTTLFVGGAFTDVTRSDGTVLTEADYITYWNGSSWSVLAGINALNGTVRALAASATDVYVGGSFTDVNGNTEADYAFKWNDFQWSALGNNGAGNGSLNNTVMALAVNGTNLYVGGAFDQVSLSSGALSSRYLALWNGSSWANPDSSLNGAIDNSTGFDSINAVAMIGTDVYVGGQFKWIANGGLRLPAASYIAKWDGTQWSALGNNGAGNGVLNNPVYALAVSGTNLYVGGAFTNVANIPAADYLAKWDGIQWSAISINSVFNYVVYALAISGTDLYVGGDFSDAANIPEADCLVKWDISKNKWSALGSNGAGNGAILNDVRVLAVNGTDLYVGGAFTNAGNIATADYIAKWDGAQWSALGSNGTGDGAFNKKVRAIALIAGNLYVGGDFTDAANILEADYLAKWDGTQWSALGSNGAGDGAINDVVYALAVSGANLYVGGDFTDAASIPEADAIARWDGSSWSALGSNGAGIGPLKNLSRVYAMAVSGGTLYAGGVFFNVNNNGTILPTADYIAAYGIGSAPTDISLSNSSVTENLPAASTVGTLSSVDPDAGNTFTYSLVSGTGSADNSAFSISGNTLKTSQPFNYLAKNSYSIRVRSTDNEGLYFEKAFTISITNAPPIFVDVPDTYWAVSFIERLYNKGVTGGCITNPLSYCPDNSVTRAQMAVFLEKGLHGSSFTPPTATGTKFTDVPTSYWAAAWIEALAKDGITGGCGNNNYCPDAEVTRAQMAVFLLKAMHGSSYTPPTASGTKFTDVNSSYWAAAWVEQLAAEAITSGCGNGNYCPDSSVTRAQMAVFLVKAFNLP